ncbi:MAG: hypothetical protein AAGB04_18725 [Pseudomonadota bacterium]
MINREGIPVSAPKTSFQPVYVSADGIDRSAVDDDDPNLRELRIGERVHVYRIRVKKNELQMLVATETAADRLMMGQASPAHLQTFLVFRLGESSDALTVENAMAKIGQAVTSEADAKQNSELLAAMQAAQGTPIPFSAQTLAKLEAKKPTASSATESTTSQTTVSTPQPTPTPQPTNRQQAPAAAWTDDTPGQISCDVASWEGVVENVADLFECDKVRAIRSLSSGREISIKIGELAFSGGKFRNQVRVRPTWREVQWNQIQQMRDGNAKFMSLVNYRSSSFYYTVVCNFSPDAIGDATEGETIVVPVTLTDFRSRTIALDCGS